MCSKLIVTPTSTYLIFAADVLLLLSAEIPTSSLLRRLPCLPLKCRSIWQSRSATRGSWQKQSMHHCLQMMMMSSSTRAAADAAIAALSAAPAAHLVMIAHVKKRCLFDRLVAATSSSRIITGYVRGAAQAILLHQQQIVSDPGVIMEPRAVI